MGLLSRWKRRVCEKRGHSFQWRDTYTFWECERRRLAYDGEYLEAGDFSFMGLPPIRIPTDPNFGLPEDWQPGKDYVVEQKRT